MKFKGTVFMKRLKLLMLITSFLVALYLTGCSRCSCDMDTVDRCTEGKQNPRMHPSWDKNHDGINDCEDDGSCDDSVDYTKPRVD